VAHLPVIVALLALMILPAAASASPFPSLLTNESARHDFQVRPAVVGYTGDSTNFLGGFDGRGASNFGHMTWLTWTRSVASGSGAVWLNDCEPSCAQGRFSPIAVRVRAFAPREGHFTRMTLRYDEDGKAIVDERGLRHLPGSPGSYTYFIVK
jgi:hypothetical protein